MHKTEKRAKESRMNPMYSHLSDGTLAHAPVLFMSLRSPFQISLPCNCRAWQRSISGITAGYSPHIYTAGKFGVVGLTKSVALELAERGIRVNAICPGRIATAIFSGILPDMPADIVDRSPEIAEPWLAEGVPLGRAGFPADIANTALWLASSESSYITGQVLVVDGGLTSGRPWSQMLNASDQLRERFQSAMQRTTVTS